MAVVQYGKVQTGDDDEFDLCKTLGICPDSGGGSRVPSSYYDRLGRAAMINARRAQEALDLNRDKFGFDVEKYNYEAELAANKLAREQAGAAAQLKYFQEQLGLGIPSTITGAIEEQERIGKDYIEDTAAELLKQLQARKGEAETLTRTGASNLMNYLARNQPTAFAQAQRAMPTITESALGRYMTGQGVSPAAAEQAAQLANIQAAGGASNYNQLLNVLAAREQAAQGSRQAEAEMGLATQLARLQGLYGAATSGLEQQRLSALAELANRIGAARLQAQQQATAREQAIRDAIASLLAKGLIPGEQEEDDTTGGGGGGGGGGNDQSMVNQASTPEAALAALNLLAPTNPNAPAPQILSTMPSADEVARLIALAQQSPQYTGGGGGIGGLLGNQAVML